MKMSGWRAGLATAALAISAWLPAQAGVVDFEDVVPILFSNSTITSGGFNFTSDGFGFSGVDNAAAFSAFANAPANADGQFLFMLNNDGMILTGPTPLFTLNSFDASFIAPVGGLGAGITAGELFVIGDTGSGFLFETYIFSPSDSNGDFNFTTFGAASLSGQALTAVAFFACIYDASGFCSFTAIDVPAQFALDNINVGINAPASLALVALALGVGGVTRRRTVR